MKHRNKVPATNATVLDALASRGLEFPGEEGSWEEDAEVLCDNSTLTWALQRLTSLNILKYTNDVMMKFAIITRDITPISSLLFIPNKNLTVSSVPIEITQTVTVTVIRHLELTFST